MKCKESNVCHLHTLRDGERARVISLTMDGGIRRRLQDIGMVEGTEIACLYHSPFGDPAAYLVRGAVIALRDEDAARISVASL